MIGVFVYCTTRKIFDIIEVSKNVRSHFALPIFPAKKERDARGALTRIRNAL